MRSDNERGEVCTQVCFLWWAWWQSGVCVISISGEGVRRDWLSDEPGWSVTMTPILYDTFIPFTIWWQSYSFCIRKLDSDQLNNIKSNDLEQIEVNSRGNWIFNNAILFLCRQNVLPTLDWDIRWCHPVCIMYSSGSECFSKALLCLHHKCNFTALNFWIRLNEQAVCKKPLNVLCDFLIKH